VTTGVVAFILASGFSIISVIPVILASRIFYSPKENSSFKFYAELILNFSVLPIGSPLWKIVFSMVSSGPVILRTILSGTT